MKPFFSNAYSVDKLTILFCALFCWCTYLQPFKHMDDFTLTFNQVGALLRLSQRYMADLIKGDSPKLESIKKVNQEKGRSMRYFRASSVVAYAKQHAIRIRAEDVQKEVKDPELIRMFAEVSTEPEMYTAEQVQSDSGSVPKYAGGEQNSEVMGLFKSTLESLQKQLDNKDTVIDNQQKTIFEMMRRQGESLALLKDAQEELRQTKEMFMLNAPKKEEQSDQQKLPLETVVHETENKPNFIILPEEKEEKPKKYFIRFWKNK